MLKAANDISNLKNKKHQMKQLIFFLTLFFLISCKTSEKQTKYKKVVEGSNLSKIPLISFDKFFRIWISNKKIEKIDLKTKELNKDSQFTYFGKPSIGLTQLKWTYFKVYSDTIAMKFPNYKEFYGSDLRDFLWYKVVPKEDIEFWNFNILSENSKLSSKCPYKNNKSIFNYSLKNKEIIVKMNWEIKCTALEKLKNKTYKASYNLETKEFKSIDN